MKKTNKIAILLSALLIILCIFSILTLFLFSKQNGQYIAHIYVDGSLYKSIPLYDIDSPYGFTITTTDGHYNEIHVEQGSIRIASADCPDLLCVKQGSVTNNLLPITCLPHHLVIKLIPNTSTANQPDAITH